MNQPTSETPPITYRFSTFQELMDRVPGDRIRDCLEEVGSVLGKGKQIAELTLQVAKGLAEAEGIEFPDDIKTLMKVPEVFEWVDDGKRDLGLRLHTDEGIQLAELKIS